MKLANKTDGKKMYGKKINPCSYVFALHLFAINAFSIVQSGSPVRFGSLSFLAKKPDDKKTWDKK
ncbi:MAG TPA: hypothetical protein VGP68_16115 [Gemmataceae bacterium]|nr:hypothetical protein [Gemmataceae bacterium]